MLAGQSLREAVAGSLCRIEGLLFVNGMTERDGDL